MFRPLVAARFVSVGSRIVSILAGLYRRGQVAFTGLFAHSRERSEVVATFLALLELMKEKRVRLEEDGTVRLTDRRQLSEEELARVDWQFSRQGESEEDDR